jgi:SAM-dependent methyltransferase
MWLPRFACPECRERAVEDGAGRLWCAHCGSRFEQRYGVYRFLSVRRAEEAARFLQQYRLVREREGYRLPGAEYYRRLPSVVSNDPHFMEWRLRRESYAHLLSHALPLHRGRIRVLDLGAGSGWLSHRLAAFGHDVVAVDQLDDEADGLGACRHYTVPFTVVQADYDALPFEAAQFDLAVFGGSLHYSPNPAATLAEAKRMLVPGGGIAVMDSPMFAHQREGQAMVEDQGRSMSSEHGLTDVVRPGAGFLTFAQLESAAASLGLRGRCYRSHGPLGWRINRQLARLRLGRAPAAFGLWVAQ